MAQYQDISLVCTCGQSFVWTEGEQHFMNRLVEEGRVDKVNQPKRCPDCRAKKKAQMNNGGGQQNRDRRPRSDADEFGNTQY